MTADSLGQGRTAVPSAPPEDPIVGRIAAARAHRRLRFRTAFAITWIVLIGGFTLWLVSIDRFDFPFISEQALYILGGAPLTIFISVTSIAVAIVFALIGAFGRISKNAVVYAVATLYISAVRGTPLIFQILFVYLALPQLWPEAAKIPGIVLGIFALAFNYGAYLTEIFRAGIEAVPHGQREAALALGMRQRRIMRRVVLPQAIRIVTPAIGNEFIAMIKDSALVSFIGVQELLWRSKTIGTANFRSLETLMLAAGVYWILTIIFSFAQENLEHRMARGDR
jgi:polar amino acid transport system permease protein